MSNDVQIRIEIDRVRNLVRGFGWEVVEEKREKEGVTILLKKRIEIPTETSS